MTAASLESSRERDDHRPGNDNTGCLRGTWYWVCKASSKSSGQGGRTRLFNFFVKFSGTGGNPWGNPHRPPNGQTVHSARQPGPVGRRDGSEPYAANRVTTGSSRDREGNSKTGTACLDVQTMQRKSPTGVTHAASRVFIVE